MYSYPMQPQLAICNIFDNDADRLAEFASLYGFTAIDWSIDPDQPADEFVVLMGRLAGFEVRYHCRFSDVDVAFADRRGDDSLALLKRTVEQVARVEKSATGNFLKKCLKISSNYLHS